MKRPFELGDLVGFQLTTGRAAEGVVIHKIVEKRQPTIFLIECGDQRRAFRFENELTLVAPAEAPEAATMRSSLSGFATTAAAPPSASEPAFAGQGLYD